MELNLRFPEINQVIVRLDDQETNTLNFISPLTAEDLEDIRWYFEVYAKSYTADVDDERAKRIEDNFQQWGAGLFEAVFQNRAAQRIFNDFQDADEPGRLLTISASHPAILSLPWELLRDPASDIYLFNENPRISVRRRLAGAGGGRKPFKVQPKESLRLLFVVSRPSDAGFIDPRGEAKAVLDAVAQEAAGKIEVEFLRPATLDNLVARLEDSRLPAIDIVHFDGHGVYDPDGRFHKLAKSSDPEGATKGENGNGSNMGYLLFENTEGKMALISAETLGEMLHRQKVGLIVLSACQSATVAGEDAMGCVAARLTHAGIPAVLAMTYSVLVVTAHQLFAKFYQRLVRAEGIGAALDNGRRDLYLNKERGERRRGDKQIIFKLQDWFLPALYQAAGDTPLLTPSSASSSSSSSSPSSPPPTTNLPELQEAGFFGRSRELWEIERWFIQGTRRITISGFGGQGKTYLAAEAGRWLSRTGMFEKVCFVNYAAFQGVDAVGLAVSTLATVLGQNLIDVSAATAALGQTPTLLILDNLESLQPEALQELLTVAKQWSEVGQCRLLLTSRTPNFYHSDYAIEGSLKHRSLPLSGLEWEDALAYIQSLWKLPPSPVYKLPERNELRRLFRLVDFHPLSLGLLARQLKMRPVAELGERLAALIEETPDNPLLASLNLSLERLDDKARELLPKLGVFQGGAMENLLLAITEISESQWQQLRPALENTGLIQPENLPGFSVPFLKFHPTLAPVLWSRLSPEVQSELLARYRLWHYESSKYLYFEDRNDPYFTRIIAQRELPNLLYAVNGSLDTGEKWVVEFVRNVNHILQVFGLNRDSVALTQRVEQVQVEVGSQTWYLARTNVGQQLYNAGRYQEAAQVFREILTGLGEEPSYEGCLTLNHLGNCLRFQGQTAQAAEFYHQGLAMATHLEQSNDVKSQMGNLQADLGVALMYMGHYDQAREAYEASLAIKEEIDDFRGIAVANGELGTLFLRQGNLREAEQCFIKSLTTFQRLNEPAVEAMYWHQLGRVYGQAKEWDAAEHAYREAARINESQGNLKGAVTTWNELALINADTGKQEDAEAWFRKAIAGAKTAGDRLQTSRSLNNLADLLQNQPCRLPEARQLAEEALAIEETLDPAAAEIWKIYHILADITEKLGETTQAKDYRRLSRQAKAAFAGTRYELQRFGWFIATVVTTVNDAQVKQQLEPVLEELIKAGLVNLVAAIHLILDGERDEDLLCEPLDFYDAPIINAILRGIADRNTLNELLDEQG
ncbi:MULTISPECIES: tetratricopeptide repeat protein [unclassified Tolypothrix]|uniref:tetratricopeptide repeat protein n=1 Tax=unclassified Tolypothrix TaxID=2649714 RepID=UPI0005EAAAB1|nr:MULTISPECIES: tetratricopeptide repeat protein [unclassified Tolypothrix]BAY91818.1 TPR domain protein [Microchaete diplosiphon NIES-3275]EKF05031.1 tetratricopeptide repeat protein [Tolypothrix sp. PCC 7601]MBE9081227.1 tetratricopeptide repeat protein [Tolypothrix sp. LEGE 11397]UYD25830.1 tetratricopeptide repeat protein [Tolypothrix sp. PCC 7712]UYD31930.1 tetratricopeptide repeat protein [Tolypothrix sp. PCC 7601]